uniref:NADH-ubiquinone oxidoreductase chain 2 n=1 Tax=Philotrypesis pilosa TaxID=358048 RepID=G8EEK7_9HYME|nr:NADH dehydrogenase subunit 2 [Philotrypesis pilosa]
MLILLNLIITLTNSWFSMWMIMEINMICFISFIFFDKHIKKEIIMNYFLIQTFNSYLFLLSMIMMNYSNLDNFIYLMYLSMFTKLGIPPFYQWYLKMMNNLNWMNIFILSIMQKYIPLFILSVLVKHNKMLLLHILLLLTSSLYSSIKGINLINLKISMSHSSIIQMNWIISNMMISEMNWIIYFEIYIIIMLIVCMIFYNYEIYYLNQLYLLKFNSKMKYYMLNFCFFSLASLPPMYGFLMKLSALQILYYYFSYLFIYLLILSSLISMFFYLRLLFNPIMFNFNSIKLNWLNFNYKNKNNYKIFILIWFNLIMMLIYEMV